MNVEKQTHVGKKVLESIIHQDCIIPGHSLHKGQKQAPVHDTLKGLHLFLPIILEPSGFETDC